MGCSPTENISRRIVEAIKARMPWGLGSAMTMARETSMAVQSSPDQCGSSVPGKTRWGVTAPWSTVTGPHGLHHTSGFICQSPLALFVPTLLSKLLPWT